MNSEILQNTKTKMEKTIEALKDKLKTVRAGRANPSSLDRVVVDYYGNPTLLKSIATISVPEATQLCIKPFDKTCLKDIEKAIFESNLGYTPNNDGESIRIVIPPLTEDRRRELIKQVKSIGEESKISIRNIRHEGLEKVKREDISEDEAKGIEKQIQDLVNKFNKEIDDEVKLKENDLMTV